jgi:hypothetical protein
MNFRKLVVAVFLLRRIKGLIDRSKTMCRRWGARMTSAKYLMCVAAKCQKHIALQKLSERRASVPASATSMSIGSPLARAISPAPKQLRRAPEKQGARLNRARASGAVEVLTRT